VAAFARPSLSVSLCVSRFSKSPVKTPFLVLICFSFIGCSKSAFGPPDVETRPKQYSSLLAEWQQRGRGLVDHFPKAIPPEATSPKLSAFPGFEERDFPADYRIFIFHARPYRPGDAHQWNHGDSRGIVVSRTHNEVIYFAEDW
jgi:hypothetical protein